jgi:HTH-type transcriptional regulator/antitoxin HigA
VTRGFNEEEYRALLTAYPPRPIEDEAELQRAEERIWELLGIDERSRAQDAYLTLLSEQVERWESEHVVMPPLSGAELVKALLAERGLRQKDLVQLFGTESIVSEVLSGKRELQSKHIERLAGFFNVSPAAFFAAREAAVGGHEILNAGGQRAERWRP